MTERSSAQELSEAASIPAVGAKSPISCELSRPTNSLLTEMNVGAALRPPRRKPRRPPSDPLMLSSFAVKLANRGCDFRRRIGWRGGGGGGLDRGNLLIAVPRRAETRDR